MSTFEPRPGTNRPDPNQPTLEASDAYVGPETWVREAIAEQEEYIKRWRSCRDILGRSHAYAVVAAVPSAPGSGAVSTYRACTVCGVTETRADYAVKQQALAGPPVPP